MKRADRFRCSIAVIAALVSGLSFNAAWASGGSGGGFGGGGGYGSSRGGSFDSDSASSYNAGKSVYERKLGCSECPMAGQSLNELTARGLLNDKRGIYLSPEESQALDTYLKRRFRL